MRAHTPLANMLDEDAKWFAVSLRIIGDAFEPTQLEGMLGLQPDHIGVMGQPGTRKQGQRNTPSQTNFWSYREESDSETGFDQQIQNQVAGPILNLNH